MASVIEVKPTGWQNNSEGKVGTAPGNDVRSVFMDKDGVTAWLLQSVNTAHTAGAGFARIRISDGSILFSGNWNNSFSSILQGRMGNTGTPLWFQIGTNYFVIDYATSILHKMIVSPSAVGSWGNSYLTDSATLDLSANLATSTLNVDAFATASVGGINYIAMAVKHATVGIKNLLVVNADAMTLVGTWQFPSAPSGEAVNIVNNPGVFFDKFGQIWVVSFASPTATPTDPNGFLRGMFLSTGSPATPSGLATSFVPASSLPTNFFSALPETFTAYNANNHSIVVGNEFTNDGHSDQGMMVLDLASKTSTASRISSTGSDIAWWDASNQAGSFSAFLLGVQPDGSLSVPAAGGISLSESFSKLNPSTFVQISSVNVVDVINSSSVADKVSVSLGISGIAFNSSFILAAFAQDVTNVYHGGSPVYIVPIGLCAAPKPAGNPYIGRNN